MRRGMNIKVKLFISFGVIIFASAILAVTALYTVSSLNSNIIMRQEARVSQTRGVTEVGAASNADALRLSEAMVAQGLDGARSELAATGNEKGISEQMEKLKASLVSGKEKTLFQTLASKRSAYTTIRSRASMLLAQGAKGEALKAVRELKSKRAECQSALADLNGYLAEQAKLEAGQAADAVSRAKTVLIALFLLTVVTAIAVACWVVGSITRQLSTAVETAPLKTLRRPGN